MLMTYQAVLKGDRLEWTEEAPQLRPDQQSVRVFVTIVPEDEAAVEARGRRMAEALEQLAELKTFAEIKDPVAWQRELRRDRPLPGRDD
jgi:hypothetical protein